MVLRNSRHCERVKAKSSKVIGYARVSTQEQADSGLGLAHQKAMIAAEADRRGWLDVETIVDEGFSAKNLSRPGISDALKQLRKGEASTLVVAKLDRLSRSLHDFSSLTQRAKREGWELVVLDMDVDTTKSQGQMVVNMMAVFAEFERQLIGERTRDALRQKKAQGIRLGRPKVIDPVTTARILARRHAGATLAAIAEELNAGGVPTARGGARWYASTIRAAIRSAILDAEACPQGRDEAIPCSDTQRGKAVHGLVTAAV